MPALANCPPAVAAMVSASKIAAVVTDPTLPDNPIVACNEAFEALTGYPADEVLGRNCRFLAGAPPEPLLVEELATAVRERRPILAEVLNFRKDGTAFRNAVMIAPMYGPDGALEHFLGSQFEIPEGPPRCHEATRRNLARLSRRQQQVLAGILGGKRNKALAHDLGIKERTVKMHRAALLAALGGVSNADAIRLAVEAGWSISDAKP